MRGWAATLGLLIAVLPAVGAAWMGPGGEEPDTVLDRTGGAMFAVPDRTAGPGYGSVYFDAFAAVAQTSLNPNPGATGARVQLAGSVEYRALLGAWKDCNADGYIGAAESALLDYPSALLPDTTICPPDGPHNRLGWVSEMIAVGMVDPCEHAPDAVRASDCPAVDAYHPNERVLYANGTYVWGDEGLPGAAPPRECALAPLPRGTTASSGALLRYADCQDGHNVARTLSAIDADGSLGLRFEDPEHPESSTSAANAPMPLAPFGDGTRSGPLAADSGRSAATAWDCDAPETAEARDPTGGQLSEVAVEDRSGGYLGSGEFPLVVVDAITGVGFDDEDDDAATPGVLRVRLTDETGAYAHLPAPASDPSMDAEGSAWEAIDASADGVRGDCAPENGSALARYAPAALVEGGAEPANGPRSRSTFTFVFYDGHRGVREELDPYTGAETPSDGGVIARRQDRGGAGPIWRSLEARATDPQVVDRETLGPQGGRYATFYARLGTDALFLTRPAGGGEYGAEACSVPTGAWTCAASAWWRDAAGNDVMPRYARGEPIGQVPRAPWHLRDVDCHDGALLRGAPLYASLALISDGAC